MASLLTEIPSCLRQAHVWRFLGLASTIVRLSCYALSSSFNHLFGRWNFLKIFIYILSSVIICFMILFAKERQFSAAFRFKAHLSFLALTITAVYSFFLDENVNGKPDVYSLISCAAFAVMSLCLSKQIHFGFEVDLLYFFLGALIVQLMKIHLFLGIFRVGFSYFLIILRSFLDSENEDHSLNLNDQSITQLCKLTQIRSNNSPLITSRTSLNPTIRIQDHVPADTNQVIDALPVNIINDLQEAAKFMLANGFEKECCDLYSSCRSEYIENFVSNLGLKLSDIVNVVEVESIALEFQVRNWISTSNLALRFLFPNERRLCERIFLGFTTVEDMVFTGICREFTIHQLNFADCFTFESSDLKTFEVFPMSVKVFKALHDLIPEYESLFSEQSCDSIRNEAINTWKRLGKATKGIFMELEDWICNDKAISDVPGGLYPICSKVIECLNAVYKAWVILPLENFFQEHPMVVYSEGSPSSFFVQLIRITELLERHLEVKFESCLDGAMRYIIAMNNVRHIEQNASKWNSETSPMYNNDMIRRLNAKVRQNLEDYLRVSYSHGMRLSGF